MSDNGANSPRLTNSPRLYDVLARTFAQEDVTTAFALLGDANMSFATRLAEQGCRMIRRHGLTILIIVLNDGAYGSEIRKLRADRLSDTGAVFGRPDLAAIARGFGIGGQTVDDLAALPSLINAFDKTGGAAVWDVPISDRVVSPVIQRAHPLRSRENPSP